MSIHQTGENVWPLGPSLNSGRGRRPFEIRFCHSSSKGMVVHRNGVSRTLKALFAPLGHVWTHKNFSCKENTVALRQNAMTVHCTEGKILAPPPVRAPLQWWMSRTFWKPPVQGGIWGRSQWGGVRQVVSPSFPFPFPSPPPFHSPYILSLPVGGKVRSSEGEVPRLPPPTNTTLLPSRTVPNLVAV